MEKNCIFDRDLREHETDRDEHMELRGDVRLCGPVAIGYVDREKN